MNEDMNVYQAVINARKNGVKSAVATVVNVTGSSYRKAGAKMYIDETETSIGLISGGCLESDVSEEAKRVIHSGIPKMKLYHMDEDVVWGLGLGCPGTVEIYIEPVS